MSNILNNNSNYRKIKHILAVSGTSIMLFGFVFSILEILFGFIPFVRNLVFKGIPIAPVVFALITIILIKKYVKISSVHKED